MLTPHEEIRRLVDRSKSMDSGCFTGLNPLDRTLLIDIADALEVAAVKSAEADARPLFTWWVDRAFDEAHQTIAKMEEYGSGDLVALGQNLRRMAGLPRLDDPVQAMELGCLVYMLGKVERAIEAVKAGRTVKDDTLFDVAVYAKMVLAARAGVWEVKG